MKRCETCNILGGDNQTACYADGQPLVDDPLATSLQEAIGEKYSLTKLIGRGAMGAVYGAHHRDLGDVAIKVMLNRRGSQTLSERFIREARALRKLRHQNAVLVYDLDRSPTGVTYMVMEMVAGRSLGQDLQEQKLFTLDETMEIATAVCSALAAAHERGIIHRDLKPDNILRAEERGIDGRVIRTIKIADFGIVKQRGGGGDGDDDDMKITKSGRPIGTPFYMSPEQWFGEGPGVGALDHRTDIYALGCTLYELLSGRPPFFGRTTDEVRQQHLLKEPQPLHLLARQVPVSVSRVIMRALAKDRDLRQQSATELLNELRAAHDESFQQTDRKITDPLRATHESVEDGEGAGEKRRLTDTEESVPMFVERVTALDFNSATNPLTNDQGQEESATLPMMSHAVEADPAAAAAPPPSVSPSAEVAFAPPYATEQEAAPQAYAPAPAPVPAPQFQAVPFVVSRSSGNKAALIIITVLLLVAASIIVAAGLFLYLNRPSALIFSKIQPPSVQFKTPPIPMSQLMGTLRVSAAPNSEVFIDDEKAGTTGTDGIVNAETPVGVRNVRVVAKDYRVWIRDARIRANERTTITAARQPPVEVAEATAEERRERASEAYDKKDYAVAEAEYRALLKDDPEDATARARLGLILNAQQRHSEAIDELGKAARSDASNTEVRAVLVRLLLLKERLTEAEATARQLVQLRPRDAAAHNALARVLLRAPDKLDEALREIETALKLKQTPDYLETKAYILLAGGSSDEALRVAQRAAELDRRNSPARAAVAVILFRMERVDEAIAAYSELRQADKSDRWGDLKRLEITRGYSAPVLQTLSALIARTN